MDCLLRSTTRTAHWPVDEYNELNGDIDSPLSLGSELANNSYSDAILQINSMTVFKQEAPSPGSTNEITNLQTVRENRQSPTSTQHHQPQQNQQNGTMVAATGCGGMDDNNSQTMFNNTINQLLSQSGLVNLQNVMDGNNLSSPTSQDNYNVSSTNYSLIEDYRFQYVLAAATSIATKQNEDTLTYLNQGQSYEIKVKKLGDLSMYRGKILRSVIRICFHERRLQYMEKEQMTLWQKARPGDRILEVDVPLSYGAFDIVQPSNALNIIHFSWDPTKEVGVYIKVNCISTEFTPKKHGGEKGVPFRIQVETYQSMDCLESSKRLHAAACQIKVFKLKGADRKHKQDREKILKRPVSEQEKYQPSYDCTVLNDIPDEAVLTSAPIAPIATSKSVPPDANLAPNRIVPKIDNAIAQQASIPSPLEMDICVPEKKVEFEKINEQLTPSSSTDQTIAWLTRNRFEKYLQTFCSFCGTDMLRMSREDLIQICGHADGIRLYNSLHMESIAPKLKIYVCREKSSVFNAVFLTSYNNVELVQKLSAIYGLAPDQIKDIYIEGPKAIHIHLSNDVLSHLEEETMFMLEVIQESDSCILLLKRIRQ
ncbi:transcription factor CP2-like protein 1 isoform X2 [Aethina tumida]|uniref:transcription factor CP2-like protein 1 isoform X2 n=1 Tax=Aethina tumida TaxID=116153 RepID=UPI00214895D1|nr:transcription factor CP2-like protein 1 isoform X2 [Aethina tumida]